MIADHQLRAAAAALTGHTGLSLTGASGARLESRMQERAAALRAEIDDYIAVLEADREEAQNLVDNLTVQETSFFRDASHFDALVRQVATPTNGPVVVWSAGCATGQEPYSLAMALDEAGVEDFQVIATDISRPAVERVRAASYRESELRGLSAARRGRYLIHRGDAWEIDPALRDRISVHHHNLLTDPVPLAARNLAAVFCRNVFIYLERSRIAPFLVGIRSHLTADGLVFVGGSESLWSVPDGYSLTRFGDAFCYRRNDEARFLPRPPEARRPSARVATPRPPRCAPPIQVEEITTDLSEVERHRQAVYRAPGDTLAHLRLGLALEAAGDHSAGLRAFRAARSTLARADHADVEVGLEGYDIGALRTMLDLKLTGEGACPP